MSILSGKEIHAAVRRGDIFLRDFDPDQLNPVSYDVRLGTEFRHYPGIRLDSRADNPSVSEIVEEGEPFVIRPGRLYLAHHQELVLTTKYCPVLDGKSSLGRLGLAIHVTAGRGEPGFGSGEGEARGAQFTLEIFSVAHEVVVYPGMRIGQLVFETIEGELEQYAGNYVNGAARGAQPSRSWNQALRDRAIRLVRRATQIDSRPQFRVSYPGPDDADEAAHIVIDGTGRIVVGEFLGWNCWKVGDRDLSWRHPSISDENSVFAWAPDPGKRNGAVPSERSRKKAYEPNKLTRRS